ncbi:glycosyltransferase [Terrilactibacillus sp. S3-3]|nr:glycosyltransferase [Terrilactibacillus sp. S3-3]
MFLSILFFLKLRKAKVVWTVHNLYPHKYRWKRLEKKVRKIIMSRCDKLIVAAYSIKASIINEFGISSDKIDVVLHGHYKGVYPTKHKDFRGEYNINPKKIIFLFVGAIKEYKGVLELLDNFVKIDNSNGHLIIAGKTYDNMEQLIEPYIGHKNITFDLRFIPDEELSDLITSSDYVVLPYKNITTSGTAILAVSLKRKIICPSSPFMKEYFDSHTAIMYDSKRTNELMNILKNCLYQHNQVIPENSYQNFLHKLSWTNIAKQIKSIYYSI